jgi:hypothetical protein
MQMRAPLQQIPLPNSQVFPTSPGPYHPVNELPQHMAFDLQNNIQSNVQYGAEKYHQQQVPPQQLYPQENMGRTNQNFYNNNNSNINNSSLAQTSPHQISYQQTYQTSISSPDKAIGQKAIAAFNPQMPQGNNIYAQPMSGQPAPQLGSGLGVTNNYSRPENTGVIPKSPSGGNMQFGMNNTAGGPGYLPSNNGTFLPETRKVQEHQINEIDKRIEMAIKSSEETYKRHSIHINNLSKYKP